MLQVTHNAPKATYTNYTQFITLIMISARIHQFLRTCCRAIMAMNIAMVCDVTVIPSNPTY